MRLIALFLVIGILTVQARGTAQKVTINEENIPLQKVISIIKKQTGYGFNLNLGNLDELPPVTVKIMRGSIKEALEQCLEDLPISYYIGDSYVVLEKKKAVIADVSMGFAPYVDGPIYGYVYDSEGKPLAEATVMVKDKPKTLVSTLSNGRFEVQNAKMGDVVVVSLVGYGTQEFTLRSSETNVIRLNVSTNKLDEVQVIAYGTTTRRLSTGNVGTVKADVIERQPVTNPLLALQGRVTGVTVVQNSGVPGGGITVRIQGRNSINSGNDPLYIVDGVPIASQLPEISVESSILGNSGSVAEAAPAGAGNPLAFINPSDIESIDVLKDADATAIYGSRAANGAILITTKQGKSGKARADFNIQNGWGKVIGRVKLLDTRQYLDMRYEAYANDGIDWRNLDPQKQSPADLRVWDTAKYTDWQKELLSGITSFLTASGSVSGGGAGINYLISGTYGKDGVPFPGDFGNRRTSLHFNLNSASSSQKLRFRFSGSFMNHHNRLPIQDPTGQALFLPPNAPSPFNNDGSINWAPDATGNSTFAGNPYRGLKSGGNTTTNNLVGSLSVNYKILPGLEISNSLGYTYTQTEQTILDPSSARPPEDRAVIPNTATYGSRNLNSWITEPQLSYKVNFGGGRLDALIGGTILENNTTSSSVMGLNYPTDAMLENLASAASLANGLSLVSQYKYAAVFGRVNYNWQDRYILNLTARRDGSSRFGANNRFHSFGAIGGAWLFSNTKFVKSAIPWLSLGKLKGSYGSTGNDQIADFRFVTVYRNVTAQVPYQNTAALGPTNLPNPNLEWELTKKMSVGLDLGLKNDRVTFSANYARNTSNNQLSGYFLPSVTGFSSYVANFPGTVRNTTWEFSLSSDNIKTKSFEWSTNVNLSIPRNKLVAYPNILASAFARTFEIGKPLNSQRLPVFAGVNATTGLYEFEANLVDGDGRPYKGVTYTPSFPEDYISVGLDPAWYGGFGNQIRVGDFTVDLFLQVVKQNGFSPSFGNGTAVSPGAFNGATGNQPINVLDRWRKPGDQAGIKKFSSVINESNNSLAYFSTGSYEDASFARLKNVSIAWRVPVSILKKIGFQSARFYTQAQNLFTVSRYKGLNPESPTVTPLLPPMFVMTLGIQIVL